MAEQVLVVAVYCRTKLTMWQLGPPFGVGEAVPVARARASRPPSRYRRPVWIGDATLAPVRDRRVGAYYRNYEFSVNVQGMDADPCLVIAAACPEPGTATEVRAWRTSGPAERCQGVTLLGDGASLK
nr:hypothetical protein [Streptomyces chartreusis]